MMSLFAEGFLGISDTLWLALIVLITPVAKYWLIERPRDRRIAARVAEVAVKAEEHADKLDSALKGIEEVHLATNGMKEELMSATAKASLAEGEQIGKDKAEKAAKKKPK